MAPAAPATPQRPQLAGTIAGLPRMTDPIAGTTRILGIDPGSQRTGVGIVDVAPDGRLRHVHHAPLQLLGEGGFPDRLRRLLDQLGEVIDTWHPHEVSIEQVFMSRNADSALKRDLPVHEYAATEIKLAVVGRGKAEKTQVQHMVGILLNLQGRLQADAADALAAAITHAHVRASAARLGVGTRTAWSR